MPSVYYTRAGFGKCTGKMLRVLKKLARTKDDYGYRFIPLPDIDARPTTTIANT